MLQIIDWEYYIERLGGCVMKIITIPAALQSVSDQEILYNILIILVLLRLCY